MDSIPSFTDERAGQLRTFLESPDRSEGTMGLSELGGFLFALACSPQAVAPTAWIPLVFGGDEPEYETLDEARDAIDLLLSFHNHVQEQVRTGAPALPPTCATAGEPLSNLGPDAPLGAWASGFLEGHQWLEELWDELVPEDLHDELASQLMILSFFSSRELAEGFRREVGGEDSLERMASTMLRLLPDAMAAYARLGRSIEQALMQLEQRRTPVHSTKVGRNEPCPCGSGRKYKRCCGAG